jgi:predicted enzyme related to lactoylglutathione lyase
VLLPMSERSGYEPGEFCWVELIAPDTDAAAGFYGELLGWDRERYEPDPEGYWYFKHDGKLVAGLEGIRAEGQMPAWLGYVRVDDPEETAAKVKDAGGAILEGPLSVPGDAGELAICQDTEGAVFALWRPGDLKGAELVNEIGSWTWNNLMSRDLNNAKDFYGKVFGWEATQSEEAPEGILNWQLEGQRWPEGLGGLMRIGSDMPPDVPPHWQVYLSVESAEKAIEQVNAAGGSTLFGPLEIPIAKLAVLNDPQGANFAILEPNYPEPR